MGELDDLLPGRVREGPTVDVHAAQLVHPGVARGGVEICGKS